MPELRVDPVTQRQVIIAPSCAVRPGAFVPQSPTAKTTTAVSCPFCPGHEDETPPAVLTYPKGAADLGDWSLRVVPNLYPALVPEPGPIDGERGFFRSRPATGRHEVVIESPRHVDSLTALAPDDASLVFRACVDRFQAWRRESRAQCPIAFKNTGVVAGASLFHTHSQLMSLPDLPPVMAAEWQGAMDFYQRQGKCVFCEIVRREIEERERLIEHHQQFVVFCPFASRVPYEIWIVPIVHADQFDLIDNSTVNALGPLVRRTLVRLEKLVEGVAYNYLIHTAPFDTRDHHHYHWHIEIIPRTTREAGFEWGTGCAINPLVPEEAAKGLISV